MKSVGICNALLRVLLSVALVVSFTPIPASAGEDATGAGWSPSASVGEQGSALSEGSGEAALTGGAAVEGIGVIGAEIRNVEVERPFAELLVRRKADAELSVREISGERKLT